MLVAFISGVTSLIFTDHLSRFINGHPLESDHLRYLVPVFGLVQTNENAVPLEISRGEMKAGWLQNV